MSTLKEISQEHMSNMSEQIFKHFVENYNEREFTMDDLKNDEIIKGYMITKKQNKTKKTKSPPKVSNEVRQTLGVNKDKCKCRIWKGGLDNIQCSRKRKDGNDFCGGKTHNADWWLGFITELRPEEPVGGTKNTRHYWHNQEIPKKSKNTPSKVGKSKKVKKEESVEEVVEKVIDEVIEELEIPEGAGVGIIPPRTTVDEYVAMMTGCSKNEDNSDVESVSSSGEEDEQVEDFDYEGVIYKKLSIDNIVLDRRSGMQMGKLMEDGTVRFLGEEERSIHIKNKE